MLKSTLTFSCGNLNVINVIELRKKKHVRSSAVNIIEAEIYLISDNVITLNAVIIDQSGFALTEYLTLTMLL